jgi:Domain of unknown function (DUF4258)
VFDRMLQRMRGLVRAGDYVVTVHGAEEMAADGLTASDIEMCFLTGGIVERQKDGRTGEWKYVLEGDTVSGQEAVAVSKVGPTKKLVIITVYLKAKST